jgi:fructokinase
MKVLAFGEILWDIIEKEEHLGGAPFNFIAHTAPIAIFSETKIYPQES